MVAEERIAKILDYLDQHGVAKVQDLAELTDVSEMTIHRDLNKLAESDLLTKVHGGAVAKRVAEIPYRSRGIHNQTAKQAIAHAALSMIRPGMTLYLGPGTTITELARVLPIEGLKVITNSLPIAQELANLSQHEIILTGGTVRRHAEALVGPSAEATANEYFIHIAFIATTGIDLDKGLTVYSKSEASVLQSFIKASRSTILLTDSSKFDKIMGPSAIPLYAIHKIICESKLPDKYQSYCDNNDIQIIVANTSTNLGAEAEVSR